jgi:aryl carrier-like protein
MRKLLVGGDRLRHLPPDDVPFSLINNYGPTETTVVATSGVVTRTGKAHIGGPIANTRIYLLDERKRVAPVGVPGELYVGGAGVGRGYLNRPELTAERFLDDPFAANGPRRMYRTGDVARWLPDGTIDFVGRNDFQVKLRGFRVELGEIEGRLGAHPEVREAVVVALDDDAANQRLVAYYTGAEVDAAELREHVAGHLPEYMLPSAFVRLHALPLTPHGKIDRRALPRPHADAYAPAGYQPPQGEVEHALARIWADVLGLDRIGRHDNFFVLGGHSLLAVTLIERMRQEGLNADVRTLFATPTIAELAATVGKQAAVAVPANRIPSRTNNDMQSLKVVL